MKITVLALSDDGELEKVKVLDFAPCDLDFTRATIEQIQKYKDNWQSVSLPNCETLEFKTEYGRGYSVVIIAVKQERKNIFSLCAEEIVNSSFLTLSGQPIVLEIELP